jgi:hypothetical protein
MSSNFIQCAFIKKDGSRCKRHIKKGKKYCWQHDTEETELKTEIEELPNVLVDYIIESYLEAEIKFKEFVKTLPKRINKKDNYLYRYVIKTKIDEPIAIILKGNEIKEGKTKTAEMFNSFIEYIDKKFNLKITIDALNFLVYLWCFLVDLILVKIKDLSMKDTIKLLFPNFYWNQPYNENMKLEYVILQITNNLLRSYLGNGPINYINMMYMVTIDPDIYSNIYSLNLPFYGKFISISDTSILLNNPILLNQNLEKIFKIFNIIITQDEETFFSNFVYYNYIENKIKLDLPTYIFNIIEYVNLPEISSYKEFTDAFLNIPETKLKMI